jgi:predicted MFS family arabinose efflux permease
VAGIKGVGYRGAYFALAVLCLVLAVLVVALIPSPADVAGATTDAERAGARLLFNHGPDVVVACGMATLGGLIGGIAFRPAARPPA